MVRSIVNLSLFVLFLLVASNLKANQPPLIGGDFKIKRTTVDNGGGQASGSQFVIRGTLGQHDVGRSVGGDYVLRTGFWTTPGLLDDALFKDRFEVIVSRLGQFAPWDS